jgi:hypothetical protein
MQRICSEAKWGRNWTTIERLMLEPLWLNFYSEIDRHFYFLDDLSRAMK